MAFPDGVVPGNVVVYATARRGALPEETDFLLLLRKASDGDSGAQERLYRKVYDELHKKASSIMKSFAHGPTLQTTMIVNDVFQSLLGRGVTIRDERHFRNTAALAMKNLLIDYVRSRKAEIHGGKVRHEPIADLQIVFHDRTIPYLELEDALRRLRETNAEYADLVELKAFGGMNLEAIAAERGLSSRTVQRRWALARALLMKYLT